MTLSTTCAQQCARHPFRRPVMTLRSLPRSLICALAMIALSSGSVMAGCRIPLDLVRFSSPLPVMQRAIAFEPAIRIAALGSSSTEGVGASNRKMCYPARLEAELNERHQGKSTFTVSNMGVGGELATDMLARIDREVLELKPHLVVWQTGVNDAIQGISIDDFRTTLVQGIAAIRAAGADVVLLGMQYYPKSSRVPFYRDYLVTMREVAAEADVPLLNRYGIMKHLIDTAKYAPADLLAPDQFHQNDFSYGCIGTQLAEAIGDGMRRPIGSRRSASLASEAPRQSSVIPQGLRMSAAR